MDTFTEGLGAGGLHSGQAIAQRGAEDIDHLAVAVCGALELAAYPLQG